MYPTQAFESLQLVLLNTCQKKSEELATVNFWEIEWHANEENE